MTKKNLIISISIFMTLIILIVLMFTIYIEQKKETFDNENSIFITLEKIEKLKYYQLSRGKYDNKNFYTLNITILNKLNDGSELSLYFKGNSLRELQEKIKTELNEGVL